MGRGPWCPALQNRQSWGSLSWDGVPQRWASPPTTTRRQRYGSLVDPENRSEAWPTHRMKIFALHPGEILKTEFMEPMGVSAYALAKALHFPGIYEVVRGESGPSVPIPHSASEGISGCPPSSGSTCRTTTTSVLPPETAPPNELSQGRTPRAWPLRRDRARFAVAWRRAAM
jgi:hypothetical protein